jgi:hypothetical protein
LGLNVKFSFIIYQLIEHTAENTGTGPGRGR